MSLKEVNNLRQNATVYRELVWDREVKAGSPRTRKE